MLRTALSLSSRRFSSIPVIQVASVLKLNVGNEATAVKFDLRMKEMTEAMRAHPGFKGTTRQVCKSEWAYEVSWEGGWGIWSWRRRGGQVNPPLYYLCRSVSLSLFYLCRSACISAALLLCISVTLLPLSA